MLKWFAGLTVVVVLGLVGYYAYYKYAATREESRAPATAVVERGSIEEVVTAQGTLEPREYVDVGAQVSGQLEKLLVDIGDTVKAGDLIAEIDAEVYESEVAGNEARVKTLQAQVAEQQALVVQARQKKERNAKLVKNQAISQEVYEDAVTALSVAEARLRSLNAQLEEGISTLEGNRANLNYTRIYAPMEGTVVSQSAREGQTLNASQTAPVIVQLADLDLMTVRAQVAEADIIKLREKMSVYFTTLGSGARRWQGEVRQILPTPEIINDVVLYNVLVDVNNEDRQLMSGMSTQMFFVLGGAQDVPLIPASALNKRQPDQDSDAGQAYEVIVLAQGEPPERRTVHVGYSDRSFAEVRDGLEEGEQVVLPGVAQKPATDSGQQRGMRRMGMGAL